MTDTLSSRGAWWTMSPYVRAREAFKTHGALRAVEGAAGFDLGQLPAEYAESAQSADYVVYSYRTPIAWHVPDTGWVMPDVRYSVTTSRHQSKIATCLPEGAL